MSKRQWQDRTNNDRHYCPLCNAWMSSDRQSISLHENGKKHREAVEKDLTRRRDEKKRKEKEDKELESIFKQVNAVAGDGRIGAVATSEVVSSRSVQHQPTKPLKIAKPIKSKVPTSDEAKSAPVVSATIKQATIGAISNLTTGHYELEGTTYLEGSTYGSCLFEDNMPIQFWTGNSNATDEDLRDLRNFNYWKTAILARVVRTQNGKSAEDISCHVSYLNNSQDMEEVLEKNVPPRRIRLVLGSDPSLPSTVEEARLALTGGEQTIMVANNDDVTPEIDDNTGFSSWSTTTVTKISTHYYEANQEKKLKLRQEKETKERNEKIEHEIRGRRMEEAKYENSHDSALGAYDVWNTSEKGGGNYKGIDITKDGKVEVSETAKSLSKGMGNVGFKKRKVMKKGVRKTSADEM